jgi:hypothetical protein
VERPRQQYLKQVARNRGTDSYTTMKRMAFNNSRLKLPTNQKTEGGEEEERRNPLQPYDGFLFLRKIQCVCVCVWCGCMCGVCVSVVCVYVLCVCVCVCGVCVCVWCVCVCVCVCV